MKIAFLFMLYDKFEKEEIWFKFFENIDKSKYNIYIHFKEKNNIKLDNYFFGDYIITENYETEWGTYSLVNLQNRLMEYSLGDINNKKIILLSGSHIPLHSFDFIYDQIINNNYSYFDFYSADSSDSKYNFVFERFNSIYNIYNYNINNWYYGSQWAIIDREICQFLLKNEKDLINIFINSKIPDEFAYINYLKENNMFENILNLKTTYVSWLPNQSNKFRTRPHVFDENELTYNNFLILKKNFFFLRKIVDTSIIDMDWIFDNNINDFYLTSQNPNIIINYKNNKINKNIKLIKI